MSRRDRERREDGIARNLRETKLHSESTDDKVKHGIVPFPSNLCPCTGNPDIRRTSSNLVESICHERALGIADKNRAKRFEPEKCSKRPLYRSLPDGGGPDENKLSSLYLVCTV